MQKFKNKNNPRIYENDAEKFETKTLEISKRSISRKRHQNKNRMVMFLS